MSIENKLVEFIGLANKKSSHLGVLSNGRPHIAGFIPFAAPTGLGKTYAIRSLANSTDPTVPPMIFVTHQKKILAEAMKGVKPENIAVVYSIEDTIKCTVCNADFEFSRNNVDFDKGLENLKKFVQGLRFDCDKKSALGKLSKKEDPLYKCSQELLATLNRISESAKLIRKTKSDKNLDITSICSKVDGNFRGIINTINFSIKKYSKKKHLDPVDKKLLDAWMTLKARVFDEPLINNLYPAIAWKKGKRKVLYLTTSKFLNGFFDGEQTIDMVSPELRGNLVCIDELDFQASVILNKLSQDIQVVEPFKRIFKVMSNIHGYIRNEQIDMYYEQEYRKNSNTLKDKAIGTLIEILSKFRDEKIVSLKRYGVDVHSLDNAYLYNIIKPEKELSSTFENAFFFKSDYWMDRGRFLLAYSQRGLKISYWEKNIYNKVQKNKELVYNKRFDEVQPFTHLDVSLVMKIYNDFFQDLGRLFTEFLKDIDPSSAYKYERDFAEDILEKEFIDSFFNISNQNVNSELDILSEERLCNRVVLENKGFNLWMLSDKDNSLKNFDVDLRTAYMSKGPDGVLTALCSSNLVIGMSATLHIDSVLENFSLETVERYLRLIADYRNPEVTRSAEYGVELGERSKATFKKPIPFTLTKAQKKELGQEVNKRSVAKNDKRQTVVDFSVLPDESEIELIQPRVSDFLSIVPKTFFDVNQKQGEMEDESSTSKARRNIFMQCILILLNAKESNQKHLAFMVSLHYVREFFARLSDSSDPFKKIFITEGVYFAKKTAISDYFSVLEIDGKDVYFCILDGELFKNNRFIKNYEEVMTLDKPVVVLTQHKTASNGINLDYKDYLGVTRDIQNLHLLEPLHYFFERQNNELGGRSAKRDSDSDVKFIYYGNKLRSYGEFSADTIEEIVIAVMKGLHLKDINAKYKKTDDYIKAVTALIIQQIGRIERVHDHTPNVKVNVSHDIAMILAAYKRLPCYYENVDIASFTSKSVIEHCAAYVKDMRLEESLNVREANYILKPIGDDLNTKIKASNAIVRDIQQGQEHYNLYPAYWAGARKAITQMDFAWEFIIPESDKKGHGYSAKNKGKKSLGLDPIEVDRINKEGFFGCGPGIQHAFIDKPDSGEVWIDRNTRGIYGRKENSDCYKYDPYKYHKYLIKNDLIKESFHQMDNLKIHDIDRNVKEKGKVWHPDILQSIVAGYLGETSQKSLLEKHDLMISTHAPNQVFEVYDLAVLDTPYVIDSKLYLKNWQREFTNAFQGGTGLLGLEPDSLKGELSKKDISWIQPKYQRILDAYRKEIIPYNKLVIATTIEFDGMAGIQGFDHKFKRVPLEKASIIVLVGCIKVDTGELTNQFKEFVNLLKESRM